MVLRVAVASRRGERIDLHFGAAEEFMVFDVTAEGAALIERRDIASHALPEDETERNTVCRMLADCKVLLVEKVGPKPQEMLARVGIEATNLYAGKPIAEALAELFAAKCAARVRCTARCLKLPARARHAARGGPGPLNRLLYGPTRHAGAGAARS